MVRRVYYRAYFIIYITLYIGHVHVLPTITIKKELEPQKTQLVIEQASHIFIILLSH